MAKKKPDSLRTLADKYNTSYESIRRIKASGIDLNDATAVFNRLSEDSSYTPPTSFQPSNKTNPKDERGLRAAIKRLQDAEVIAHNNYLESLKADAASSMRFLKEWNTILNSLRHIEESNPDIEEANSNSISKEELTKSLGKLFSNLRQDLESLQEKISTQCQNKEKEYIRNCVSEETGRIIDSLFSYKV